MWFYKKWEGKSVFDWKSMKLVEVNWNMWNVACGTYHTFVKWFFGWGFNEAVIIKISNVPKIAPKTIAMLWGMLAIKDGRLQRKICITFIIWESTQWRLNNEAVHHSSLHLSCKFIVLAITQSCVSDGLFWFVKY